MPSMVLLNLRSQFLPPTSLAVGGTYVPILHNVSNPTPPTVGSSGPTSHGPIGPIFPLPTSSWVPPQQPNIGNQYLSRAQYNNILYVPCLGGVTNQWNQPIYGPQVGLTKDNHLWGRTLLTTNILWVTMINLSRPMVLLG